MKMKKQKLTLNNLEVKSFVTNLNSSGIKTIQAGFGLVFDSSGATGNPTCTEPNPPVPASCLYDCSVPNQCIQTNKTGHNFCPAC